MGNLQLSIIRLYQKEFYLLCFIICTISVSILDCCCFFEYICLCREQSLPEKFSPSRLPKHSTITAVVADLAALRTHELFKPADLGSFFRKKEFHFFAFGNFCYR